LLKIVFVTSTLRYIYLFCLGVKNVFKNLENFILIKFSIFQPIITITTDSMQVELYLVVHKITALQKFVIWSQTKIASCFRCSIQQRSRKYSTLLP